MSHFKSCARCKVGGDYQHHFTVSTVETLQHSDRETRFVLCPDCKWDLHRFLNVVPDQCEQVESLDKMMTAKPPAKSKLLNRRDAKDKV